jgi:hypothetical protein
MAPALRKALLACGVAYSAFYVIINDIVAAPLNAGYSRMSQAISELSATAAPTQALLAWMIPVSMALMIAFGLGVYASAGERRALRATGGVLIAQGATFPLWLLAPMTSRERMEAGVHLNDVGHIVLTVITILLILSELGCGAAALGRRFRQYSAVTAAIVVGFGALTGVVSKNLSAGLPTPWLGLYERISIGAWLLWLAALAIALSKNQKPALTETSNQSLKAAEVRRASPPPGIRAA